MIFAALRFWSKLGNGAFSVCNLIWIEGFTVPRWAFAFVSHGGHLKIS